MQVLAPFAESEEAHRSGVLEACESHDDGAHDQAVQASRQVRLFMSGAALTALACPQLCWSKVAGLHQIDQFG